VDKIIDRHRHHNAPIIHRKRELGRGGGKKGSKISGGGRSPASDLCWMPSIYGYKDEKAGRTSFRLRGGGIQAMRPGAKSANKIEIEHK